MKILGIDASLSATGICLLDTDSFNNKSFISKTLSTSFKGMERLLYIEKQVAEYAEKADYIVMENYAFDAKYNREVLGELQGILKRRLYLMKKQLLLIDTHKLKKVLTGKSKNPTTLKVKDWIVKSVNTRYNIDFTNRDDECDAFGLALIGLCYYDQNSLQSINIDDTIYADIKEVIQSIANKPMKKVKKNLSYYFALPYDVICTKENETYIARINDLDVVGEGSTIKKALSSLEKSKRLAIRALRKNKKRVKFSKNNAGRVRYIEHKC